ncbi:MAG: polysaccharide pyruvyl transferase family protein [Pseudomonadota bacterium]|nr:polysaccharide pyruvyl transferase family protein [Pseudomonadota bacterium]
MDKSKSWKVGISGGDSWVNSGDEAILVGTLQLLKNLESIRSITIITGNYNRTHEQFPDYDLINRNNIKEYIRGIKNIDVFFWGGGHLIQNTSSKLFLLYQLFLVEIAIILNKKVVGFCLGVEKINGKFWQWLTKQVLNKFDLISVRDEYSLSILNDMGLKTQLILTADPAVLLRPSVQNIKKNDHKKPYVVVSPRKWFDYDSSFLPVKFQRMINNKENTEFVHCIEVLATISDWIIEELGYGIYFISMYIENEQNDNEVAKRIYSSMKNKNMVQIIDSQLKPIELINFISNSEFLIGMRMHSTILGACANVPIIGLYYQNKGRSFFESLDISDLIIPIEEINKAELILIIDKVINNRHQISEKMKRNLFRQRELVKRTVEEIDRRIFRDGK